MWFWMASNSCAIWSYFALTCSLAAFVLRMALRYPSTIANANDIPSSVAISSFVIFRPDATALTPVFAAENVADAAVCRRYSLNGVIICLSVSSFATPDDTSPDAIDPAAPPAALASVRCANCPPVISPVARPPAFWIASRAANESAVCPAEIAACPSFVAPSAVFASAPAAGLSAPCVSSAVPAPMPTLVAQVIPGSATCACLPACSELCSVLMPVSSPAAAAPSFAMDKSPVDSTAADRNAVLFGCSRA